MRWPSGTARAHVRGGLRRSCRSLQLRSAVAELGEIGRTPNFGGDPWVWITLRRRNSPPDLGSLCPTGKWSFRSPPLNRVWAQRKRTKALVLVGVRFQSPHHQAFRSLPTCSQGHRSPSSENSPRKGIINGRLVSLCKRKRSLILPRFLYPLPIYFHGDASKPKPDPRSVARGKRDCKGHLNGLPSRYKPKRAFVQDRSPWKADRNGKGNVI